MGERHGGSRGAAGPLPRRRAGRHRLRRRRRAAALPHRAEVGAGPGRAGPGWRIMAGRERAAAAGRLLRAGLPVPPGAAVRRDGGNGPSGLWRGQVGAAGRPRAAGGGIGRFCRRGGVDEARVQEGTPPHWQRQQKPAGHRPDALFRIPRSCFVPLCARTRGLAAAGARLGNPSPFPAPGGRLAVIRGAPKAPRGFPLSSSDAFEAGKFSSRVGWFVWR